MPELPEVEACGRNLARWGRGRRVVAVHVPDAGAVRSVRSTRPSDGSDAAARGLDPLVGAPCGPLQRHGKRLAWRFGDHGVLLHLGMTGRWVRRGGGDVPRFARVGWTLDDGATLWFDDSRRFGCVVPLPADALAVELSRGLGPDALDAAPDGPALRAALPGRRAIKVALMDQGRLAGVGNIQAAEALHRAGLHPETPCHAVSPAAWARLARAIPEQLRHTLALTEDEEVVYVSDGGDNPFEVYGRAGQPCPRCGGTVVRAVHAGRSTFWCPDCQPLTA
ncbi:MAG: formamidopyrimidine-DNA glycosylase [Alphaproteobacteria bacterium]|nr:formamidopyrimidine-DNA glycosylase [Alphaproteobacteria bacterium]